MRTLARPPTTLRPVMIRLLVDIQYAQQVHQKVNLIENTIDCSFSRQEC
jgi:hypothetical protein